MIKFCRNCGKELVVASDKTCSQCGVNSVKATAFCRYCGHPTNVQDVICSKCGAAIKPIPSRERSLFQGNPKLVKQRKILNLTIVAIIVALYVWFSIPPRMARQPLKAVSDLVLSSTGYSAFPLRSIKAFPPQIPILADGAPFIYFSVNDTQQLTISAIYSNNSTGVGRSEDVTTNSIYQSGNDQIATVTTGGFVHGVASGSTFITVSYTAAPGSSNISSAAQGKVPITARYMVLVTVR